MPTCSPQETKNAAGVLPLLLIVLSIVALLTAGCERCSTDDPLAELIEKAGEVDRDTAKEVGEWFTAKVGSRYELGDAVKTGQSAQAVLGLDDGSELVLDERTIVRFSDREPGSKHHSLDVEMGSASLEAPEHGAVLETAFGLARLEGGTTVRLARSDQSLRYEVLVGKATLEDAAGTKATLEVGQALEVAIGSAVLEPIAEPGEEDEREDEKEELEIENGPIRARVKGEGVRLQRGGQGDYEALAGGEASVDAGSVFEVPEGAHVAVSRGKHRATLRGGGSYIVGSGDDFVRARSGSLSIESEGSVRVAVPGGVIVTQPGGSAELTDLGEKGVRVLGTRGRLSVQGNTKEELVHGQEATLSRDGDVSVEGRGLDYADVEIRAGETVVIHDPSPPTAVRFLFGDACRGGAIELAAKKERAAGQGAVALPVQAGSTGYTLHCLDGGQEAAKAASGGTITVLRDAGTRAVPKTAPSTYVEVDGRRYTVLYQNQLPQVSLKWSKAPPGVASFKLRLAGPSGSRTITTSQPSHLFRSGTLGPGSHQVYFEGGGQVSRKSTIVIRFDNATPTASLSTPVATGANPGAPITIAGTALPGWDVEVGGKPVDTDATGAFSLPARMPSDQKAIAVRLSHPQRGTHIYLRRAKGAQ